MSTSSINGVRILARSVLATAAFVLAVAAFAASNAGAVKIANPSDVPGGKDFVAAITGGYVQINGSGSSGPVQNTFSLNFGNVVEGQPDPRPLLRGTVSSNGTLLIPKAQVQFPPITFPVDETHNVDVTFVATNDWTGSVDPLTGKVTLTAKLMITLSGNAGVAVLDPASCRIGTPTTPVTISGSNFVGDAQRSVTYRPDPSKVAAPPASYAFPGGALSGEPYSDEAALWPYQPFPVGQPFSTDWGPSQNVTAPAGSFRVVDDTLAVPASSGCLGGAGDGTINNLLGLGAATTTGGNQRASFDISFLPYSGRTGANAYVQKGVKANVTAPGLSTTSWPATETPQLPTQVPLTLDASASSFAGAPNPGGQYSFDLGDGTFGAYTSNPIAQLSNGYATTGLRTIRVRVRDADGDVDIKTRTINVVPSSDISIAKTADAPSFRAGSDGSYTIDVHNNSGPAANSQPVTVTDTLPTGTTLVSASGAAWNCTTTSSSFSCTRPTGSLALGASAPISVVVAVSPGAPSSISNTAMVTQLGDPVAGNDTSTAVTPVRKTDLAVSVTHSPATFPANGVSSFGIQVDNVGTGETVGSSTVTATLPAGLTYVPAGSGGGGWSCAVVGQVVTCTRAASIEGLSSAPALTLRAKAANTLSGSVDTSVSVATADDVNAAAGADSVVEHVTVETVPDLALSVSHSPSTFIVGGDASVDLVATNESILSVTGTTTITSDLPDGLTAVGTPTGDGWSCAATTATVVSCTTDQSIASGQAAPAVHVPLRVGHHANPGTTLTATLHNAGDGYGGNDSSSEAIPVNRVDISVNARVDESNFSVGVPGRYKIAVRNEGTAATVGPITVVDDLPETVSYASAAGPGWSCAAPAPSAPRHVVCERAAALAPGAVAPELVVTVDVTDAAAAAGTVANTVTVSTDRDDPAVAGDADVTGNNTSTATINAISVDVAVVSLTHSNPFRVGAAGQEYHLKVGNVGAIPTVVGEPVTVKVELPAGVTPGTVAVQRSGWTCDDAVVSGAHRITCVITPGAGLSALPAKTATSDASFTIPVDVDDSAPALADAVATVTTLKDADAERSPNNVVRDATTLNRIDLDLTATEGNAPFAGHTGSYVAHLANDGTAATVAPSTVVATLPGGTAFRAGTSGGSGWNCSATSDGGTAVSCTRTGTIAPGQDAPDLTISYDVEATPAAASWTQDFSASTTGEPATRLANNEDDVASTLQVVDFTLSKSHTPGLHAGEHGTADLVVHNTGNRASSAPITVVDTLDADHLVAISAGGDGWRCDAPDVDNALRCTYLDSAPAGGSLPAITTVFRARSDADGDVFDSDPLATVSGDDDVRNGNDTAADPTRVIVGPDVSVTEQTGGTVTLHGGTAATDGYDVRNAGAADAPDVEVDVTYTAGIALSSLGNVAGWDCDRLSATHATCQADDPIEARGVTKLKLPIVPQSSAIGTDQSSDVEASVAGDANAANDTVSRDFSIAAPDLSVTTLAVEAYTAPDTPNALLSGEQATYSSTIKNVGDEKTTGQITAVFDLPSGAGFTGSPLTTNYGADWTCHVAAGNKIACAYGGALAPDGSTTVRIPMVPAAENAPSISPSLTVATLHDANPANDTRTVTDTVVKPPSTDVPPETTPTTTTPIPPGGADVSGRLTTGAIKLGTLPELALSADQLKVSGNVSPAGALTLPQSKVKFTTIPVDAGSVVPGATAKILLSAAGDGSGTLPWAGGSAAVHVPVIAKIEVYAASGAPLLNLGASSNCTIGPIDFDLTGTYDSTTKLGTFSNDAVTVPAPGAGCGPIGATLGTAIGIPSSTNAVSLTLQFAAGSLPEDPPVVDPPVTTPDPPGPPPVTPTPKEGKIKPSSASSSVSKTGRAPVTVTCTSTQAIDSCAAGKVSLKAKVKVRKKKGKKTVTVTRTVTVGTASYPKLAPGKKATVTVTLNRTGRALAKPGRSFKVSMVLQSSAKGAKAVTGTLTLKYPKAAKKKSHKSKH